MQIYIIFVTNDHYDMNLSSIKPLMIFLSLSIVPAMAQPTLQKQAEAILADPSFRSASVGVCVKDASGQKIVDINADKSLVPASNMKLITTGAALHRLGADYRFRTEIGYSGQIIDGTLHGDLYIIGGGDPTLGSKDSIAVDIEKNFNEWEKCLRKAGIRRIEGAVIGDGRHFEGMAEEPSWLWADIGTYYGSGATGLMFYENMQSVSVSAGPEVGAKVNIKPYYPEAGWMEFRYDCSTGKAGTGDRLYMYTSDLAPVAEIRGTFGVDRAAKRVDCSNKFPEYTCAHLFTEHLKRKGIRCTKGAVDFRLKRKWMEEREAAEKDEITIIGHTDSPVLGRIAFETNHASNNLYAETLLRTLGKEFCSCASYDSSYVAIHRTLTDLGVPLPAGMQIQDGSGLSRQNYISPDYICSFLVAMTLSPVFDVYLASLPIPGGNGTLSYNMKKYPESVRAGIRVKSGSMNGVRCYSGYILPSSSEPERGTMTFSIMVNNCTSPNWKVRPLLDKLMAIFSVPSHNVNQD